MRKISYCSGKAWKFTEEDSYQSGCDPHTSQSMLVDIEFSGESTKNVLDQIKDYYSVDDGELLLNSCDELGRVDVQVLETEDSNKASKNDIVLWKGGKKKLWNSIYTYHIQKVTTEEVKL